MASTDSSPAASPVPAAPRTPEQIEADMAAARERLAATVDELAYRTQPSTLVNTAKQSALGWFRDPDSGQPRWGRIAAVAGSLVVLIVYRARRGGDCDC
jgi:hypothetical protein